MSLIPSNVTKIKYIVKTLVIIQNVILALIVIWDLYTMSLPIHYDFIINQNFMAVVLAFKKKSIYNDYITWYKFQNSITKTYKF